MQHTFVTPANVQGTKLELRSNPNKEIAAFIATLGDLNAVEESKELLNLANKLVEIGSRASSDELHAVIEKVVNMIGLRVIINELDAGKSISQESLKTIKEDLINERDDLKTSKEVKALLDKVIRKIEARIQAPKKVVTSLPSATSSDKKTILARLQKSGIARNPFSK